MKDTTKKVVTVELDSSELATVLAALRYWQEVVEHPAETSPDHFEDVLPLTDKHIDDLCERINCSDAPEDPVIVIEGDIVQDVFLPIPNGKLPCTSIPYSLIDYDNLKEMSDEEKLDKWNSFSSALQKYYRVHCQDEFETYFQYAIDGACDCADRSWHGPEHDTACPVEGQR